MIETSDKLTEVSEWFTKCAVLILTTLCTAGIDSGFSDSLCRLTTCSVPGMQVVLVVISALGVGLIAFCLVMTDEVLLHDVVHLDLVWLPRSQIAWFTTPGSSIIISDSNSGLCRNKFDTKSRVVACWIKS